MIKLFTESFCIRLDGSFSIYKNQVLKNVDYLTNDICIKIGKKIAKLGLELSPSFNVCNDIILYVSSINSITSSNLCIFNVAVCLK